MFYNLCQLRSIRLSLSKNTTKTLMYMHLWVVVVTIATTSSTTLLPYIFALYSRCPMQPHVSKEVRFHNGPQWTALTAFTAASGLQVMQLCLQGIASESFIVFCSYVHFPKAQSLFIVNYAEQSMEIGGAKEQDKDLLSTQLCLILTINMKLSPLCSFANFHWQQCSFLKD